MTSPSELHPDRYSDEGIGELLRQALGPVQLPPSLADAKALARRCREAWRGPPGPPTDEYLRQELMNGLNVILRQEPDTDEGSSTHTAPKLIEAITQLFQGFPLLNPSEKKRFYLIASEEINRSRQQNLVATITAETDSTTVANANNGLRTAEDHHWCVQQLVDLDPVLAEDYILAVDLGLPLSTVAELSSRTLEALSESLRMAKIQMHVFQKSRAASQD